MEGATGAGVTVMEADPDRPSLVAVIVTDPVLMPLTTPEALTEARAVLLDDHETDRPWSTPPLASLRVAAS